MKVDGGILLRHRGPIVVLAGPVRPFHAAGWQVDETAVATRRSGVDHADRMNALRKIPSGDNRRLRRRPRCLVGQRVQSGQQRWPVDLAIVVPARRATDLGAARKQERRVRDRRRDGEGEGLADTVLGQSVGLDRPLLDPDLAASRVDCDGQRVPVPLQHGARGCDAFSFCPVAERDRYPPTVGQADMDAAAAHRIPLAEQRLVVAPHQGRPNRRQKRERRPRQSRKRLGHHEGAGVDTLLARGVAAIGVSWAHATNLTPGPAGFASP